MNYLSKYLKYKDKYLNLKFGGAFQEKIDIEQYLNNNGVFNFEENIPEELLNKPFIYNQLKMVYNIKTWKNLIHRYNSFSREIDLQKRIKNEMDMYFNSKKTHDNVNINVDIKHYLNSKNIYDFRTEIPQELLNQPSIKKSLITWNNLIYRYNSFNRNIDLQKKIIKDMDMYFQPVNIPEIFLPIQDLNFIDLSKMTSTHFERTGPHEYEFEMTHLLFEKNILSALYYYIPGDNNKYKFRSILYNYYTSRVEREKILENNDQIPLLEKELDNLASDNFLSTPKYIRIGRLEFKQSNIDSIIINNIDAWIMKRGSGLQMICSLLKYFLINCNKIFLTPETYKVGIYWGKLGFKKNSFLNIDESHVNDNINETILSKCLPLEPHVKLILKLNGYYTDKIELVRNI